MFSSSSLRPAWVLLSGALFGCGGNVCDRQAAVGQVILDRAKDCRGVTLTMPSHATCEAALPVCTDGDIRMMHQTLDCQERVAACVPGSEQSFIAALNGCRVPFSSLSQACAQALSR